MTCALLLSSAEWASRKSLKRSLERDEARWCGRWTGGQPNSSKTEPNNSKIGSLKEEEEDGTVAGRWVTPEKVSTAVWILGV